MSDPKINKEIECKLHKKIFDHSPLSKKDIENLSLIIKEQLKFMVRNNILPFPENYRKWFFIFCYAIENGLDLIDDKLFDLYRRVYKEEENKYLFMDIKNIIESLGTVADDLNALIKEHKNYSYEKELELNHLKDLEKSSEMIESVILSLINNLRDIQKRMRNY